VKNHKPKGLGVTLFCVSLIAVSFCGLTPLAAEEKARPTQEYGKRESLPFGAIVRLGESRYDQRSASTPPLMYCAVTYSPEGETLALLRTDTTLFLLDAESGKELHRIKLAARAYSLAFAPDGKSIVTGNGQSWDPKTGKEGVRFGKAMAGEPKKGWQGVGGSQVAFAPDGKTLVSAYLNTVRLWNTKSGGEITNAEVRADRVREVAFSPDGKQVLLVCDEQIDERADPSSILVLNSENLVRTGRLESRETYTSAAFSPEGKKVAACTESGAIDVLDLENHRGGHGPFPGQKGIVQIAWDDKEKGLVSLGEDGCLITWNRKGEEKAYVRLRDKWSRLSASRFALSPNGKDVAVLFGDHGVDVRDRAKGERKFARFDHRYGLSTVAFSPDGKTVATAGNDMMVLLWDAATGKQTGDFTSFTDPIPALAFTADGKELGVFSRKLVWFPLDRNLKALSSREADEEAKPICLSQDGSMVAAIAPAKAPRILDRQHPREWQPLAHQVIGRPGGICAAFSRDGRWLAVGTEGDERSLFTDEEGLVTVWNVPTKKVRSYFGGHPRNRESRITALAISPDGMYLAYAEGTEISLRNIDTGVEVRRFKTGEETTNVMAFSPDGRLLATAGPDKTHVRLWEVATAMEIRQLKGHTDPVTALAFSPDGTRLASASTDSSCVIWNVYAQVNPSLQLKDELDDKKLDSLWTDLRAHDTGYAYDAIAALAHAPKQSLPYIKARWKDYPGSSDKRIAKLISDLLDGLPPGAERAYDELAELEDAALPAIQKALEGSPPDFAKRQLERLVKIREQGIPVYPSAERLALRRSLAVLELVGDKAALEVLVEAGKGDERDPLIREVNQAAKRIAAKLLNLLPPSRPQVIKVRRDFLEKLIPFASERFDFVPAKNALPNLPGKPPRLIITK
jgi:WD40 repeat protein